MPDKPRDTRTVARINCYLPAIYEDQVIVDFVCGCWQGSREPTFKYDCLSHAVYVINELDLG